MPGSIPVGIIGLAGTIYRTRIIYTGGIIPEIMILAGKSTSSATANCNIGIRLIIVSSWNTARRNMISRQCGGVARIGRRSLAICSAVAVATFVGTGVSTGFIVNTRLVGTGGGSATTFICVG